MSKHKYVYALKPPLRYFQQRISGHIKKISERIKKVGVKTPRFSQINYY